jgi:hypothetical protein
MTANPNPSQPTRTRTSMPFLNRTALTERWREWNGGHEAETSHAEHLSAAVDWLVRAQQATACGGIARGYSLTWDSYFGASGWQPAYPETTGYIIPTLYAAAQRTTRARLAACAEHAARWEQTIQLPTGAVRGGVIGQATSPAVFNTGQVIFGWLAAFQRTYDPKFADSARRAASFLESAMDADGIWRRSNSRFALRDATMYNARTAWSLAEAGRRLGMPECTNAAARNLASVAARQHDNGWIPDCCLNDPDRPLLHTIAYAIRGMLEGGRILDDDRLISCAATAAAAIAEAMSADGTLPGRLTSDWKSAAPWSCLTGEAQMGGIWLRLFEITNERRWLEPVPAVIKALKRTQNRTSDDPGLRGGIKGSGPLGGGYGPYQTLSWATKVFADLLLRDDAVRAGIRPLDDDMLLLA